MSDLPEPVYPLHLSERARKSMRLLAIGVLPDVERLADALMNADELVDVAALVEEAEEAERDDS